MGEHIADNFKREAMKVPFLRDLLLSDSIYVASNITFENLAPLSTYLGKPGDPERGGIDIEEYIYRQRQHRAAEISAMADTRYFIERAKRVYSYDKFLCDTSGSLCEVVDTDKPCDPVMSHLSEDCLIVYIREEEAHREELARRFDLAPKPMYYNEAFLRETWARYLAEHDVEPAKVDPDHFIRWAYRALLDWRAPRYRAMAQRWGYSVTMAEIAAVETVSDFDALIRQAIDRR